MCESGGPSGKQGQDRVTHDHLVESLDDVKSFIGEDYRRAHLPENARFVLKRCDATAEHLHIIGHFS